VHGFVIVVPVNITGTDVLKHSITGDLSNWRTLQQC